MIDTLLAQLAPHSCCGCTEIGEILCQSCKNDIISDPFEVCLVCSRPCTYGNVCEPCRQEVGLTSAWCVASRQGHVKALLDRYKFDAARHAASVIADLLDARLPMLPKRLIVTSVPTAPANRRVRGFDHVALIARHFARRRGLRYQSLLAQTQNTSQHFKSRGERLKTSGISVRTNADLPEKLLLIDDIYTTGATARASIRALQGAGAHEIHLAIIARQPLDVASDIW